MKITKQRLKQIIKEELETLINEQDVSWWSSVSKFFPNVETAKKRGQFRAKGIIEDGAEVSLRRFKNYLRDIMRDVDEDEGKAKPFKPGDDPTKEVISPEEKVLHDGFLKAFKTQPVITGIAMEILFNVYMDGGIQEKREALKSLNALLK
jgi:hypothetical protein